MFGETPAQSQGIAGHDSRKDLSRSSGEKEPCRGFIGDRRLSGGRSTQRQTRSRAGGSFRVQGGGTSGARRERIGMVIQGKTASRRLCAECCLRGACGELPRPGRATAQRSPSTSSLARHAKSGRIPRRFRRIPGRGASGRPCEADRESPFPDSWSAAKVKRWRVLHRLLPRALPRASALQGLRAGASDGRRKRASGPFSPRAASRPARSDWLPQVRRPRVETPQTPADRVLPRNRHSQIPPSLCEGSTPLRSRA